MQALTHWHAHLAATCTPLRECGTKLTAPPLCPSTAAATVSLRSVVVARGRRDGNSQARKRDRRRRGPQREGGSQGEPPSSIAGAWWEDDDEVAAQPAQRWGPTSAGQQAEPQQPQQRGGVDEDEQADVGWWQKPEERSLTAYAPRPLAAWQVQRLEEAYAQHGRRKMKIIQLSRELDLDRSEVLHWVKEFALKPDSEREAVLTKRAAESIQKDVRARVDRVADAAQVDVPQHPAGQKGFIPFYTRKEMGLADFKRRRLSADALRTLEALYARNPFPSDDAIRGMWDLHRVNRERTLQWLEARRAEDGVVSHRQAAAAARGGGPGPLTPPEVRLTAGQLRKAMGPLSFDGDNLLVQAQEGAGAGPGGPEGSSRTAKPEVVPLSRKQLAMMQSSLPSPAKHKGRTRNEAMGIKQDSEMMQVGGIKYVRARPHAHRSSKWVAGWRHRRAIAPPRILPLLTDDAGTQE